MLCVTPRENRHELQHSSCSWKEHQCGGNVADMVRVGSLQGFGSGHEF